MVFFLGGGAKIAYILIGGSCKCRHIADRGGEGVKKGPKTAYILKERPLSEIYSWMHLRMGTDPSGTFADSAAIINQYQAVPQGAHNSYQKSASFGMTSADV